MSGGVVSRFTRVLSVMLLFGWGAVAGASESRASLDAFTHGLQGLSGQFQQRVYDQQGYLSESSRGAIALAIPSRFRWEYETPFPQLIIADGDKVWIYDPDLEQVQVRPQGVEEQQSPLMALVDPAELDRQFIVSDGGEAAGLLWVELTPRGEDAPFSEARLGFESQRLAKMEMTDALGQRTEVEFTEWQRNPDFDADTFRFSVPEGVDVIGEVSSPADVYPVTE